MSLTRSRFAAAPLAWAVVVASTAAQPPGGPPGGFRGPDPEEIVERMDANHNGRIDPEEMEGRARYFLEGMARDHGLDLSRPIPNDRLRELLHERFGGGPDRRGDSSRSDDGKSRRNGEGSMPVAAFDAPPGTTPVPGFGPETGADSWESIRAKYDRRIVEKAEESMRKCDENKNGVLDGDEWRRLDWSTSPRDADKNKDGRLSRSEVAERYAQRYASRSDGSSPSSSRSSSSPSTSTSSASSGGDDRTARYAEGFLKQYDANRDGVLQKDEWSKMRGDPKKYDRDGDDRITKEELARMLADYGKGGGSSSRGDASASTASASSAAAGTASRKSYRFLTPAERRPRGLPDWFARSDADGDGQVAMGEFAASWDDARAAEFTRWDRNGDGLITSAEALAGEKK